RAAGDHSRAAHHLGARRCRHRVHHFQAHLTGMNPFSAFSQRISDTISGLGYTAASYAVIAILAAVGIGFLIAAAFMLVADALGPLAATAIFGAVFLIVAGIWAAILAARAREQQRRRREAAAS